jgi:hypothetical protein
MSDWEPSTDALAIAEREEIPPYIGSEINLVQPEGYMETLGLVLREGAPMPEDLWRLSTYDPLFYVGLMAKWGYITCAWKAIDGPPPQIKPYIPPRPVPAYLGINTSVGDFMGQTAPEFSA